MFIKVSRRQTFRRTKGVCLGVSGERKCRRKSEDRLTTDGDPEVSALSPRTPNF